MSSGYNFLQNELMSAMHTVKHPYSGCILFHFFTLFPF